MRVNVSRVQKSNIVGKTQYFKLGIPIEIAREINLQPGVLFHWSIKNNRIVLKKLM